MNPTLLFVLVGGQATVGASANYAGPLSPNGLFPYRSSSFSSFIEDSYKSAAGPAKFYSWFESAYRKSGFHFQDKKNLSLTKYLKYKASSLAAISDPAKKEHSERAFAASLHTLVKKVIPHFSLEEGFEFKNAVEHGQRQCFLQSVLISGLLQRGGVPAGVAMVNRNIEGQETNNKHAVAIARLANGRDIIVDASEDTPFAKQQGLFVGSINGYRFVRPVYARDASILEYRNYGDESLLPVAALRPLPRSFVRSQFDYYRGERTQGGVMAKNKTPQGLALAADYLSKSVKEEPENPLAEYMLGRVELNRGEKAVAAHVLERALKIYERQGWVPPDERMALNQATGNS